MSDPQPGSSVPPSGAQWNRLVTGALVFLDLFARARSLVELNFRYVTEDQTTLWYVARDFAAGHIREPCWPGQAYGTAVEAMLAGPLLWLHIPVWQAVPIAYAALSLSPFFIWAWLARRNPWAAWLILIVPLTLPLDYEGMTNLEFSGALFAATAGFAGLQSRRVGWIVLGGFAAVTAWSFNTSMLILVVPYGAYLVLTRWREWHFWAGGAIGGAAGCGAHWWSRAFYVAHPTWALHPAPKLKYDANLIKESLPRAAQFFDPVSPAGSMWVLAAIMAVLLVVLLWQRKFAGALTCLVLVACAIGGLAVEKVHDGEPSIFFSWARAYLAVPLGPALLLYIAATPGRGRRLAPVALILGVAAFAAAMSTFEGQLKRIVGTRAWNVGVNTVDELRHTCATLDAAVDATATPLVVFPRDRVYAYACPALSYDKVTALFPSYERRTWLLEHERETTRDRMLVWAPGQDPCGTFRQIPNCQSVDKEFAALRFDPQPSVNVMQHLGINVRRF